MAAVENVEQLIERACQEVRQALQRIVYEHQGFGHTSVEASKASGKLCFKVEATTSDRMDCRVD